MARFVRTALSPAAEEAPNRDQDSEIARQIRDYLSTEHGITATDFLESLHWSKSDRSGAAERLLIGERGSHAVYAYNNPDRVTSNQLEIRAEGSQGVIKKTDMTSIQLASPFLKLTLEAGNAELAQHFRVFVRGCFALRGHEMGPNFLLDKKSFGQAILRIMSKKPLPAKGTPTYSTAQSEQGDTASIQNSPRKLKKTRAKRQLKHQKAKASIDDEDSATVTREVSSSTFHSAMAPPPVAPCVGVARFFQPAGPQMESSSQNATPSSAARPGSFTPINGNTKTQSHGMFEVTRTVNISSDSSQAEEDHEVEHGDEDSPNIKYTRQYNTKTKSYPQASVGSGGYGMFSTPPTAPSHPPVVLRYKRKKNDQLKVATKKAKKLLEGPGNERGDGPSTEPNFPTSVGHAEDYEKDSVMGSPVLTPTAQHGTQPMLFTLDAMPNSNLNVEEDFAVDPTDHVAQTNPEGNMPTAANNINDDDEETTLSTIQHSLETSPLPGTPSHLTAYLSILQAIQHHPHFSTTHTHLSKLTTEDTQLASLLSTLPTEEKQHLDKIAKDLAHALQADMARVATSADPSLNMSSFHSTYQRRNDEAAAQRHSVQCATQVLRAQYEARRTELQEQRASAVAAQEQHAGAVVEFAELLRRKRELEDVGGMALGFELGRRYDRLLRMGKSARVE